MTDTIPATCDGQTLKRLAEAGKIWLEHNYKVVNDLNVFPVPDGDTGTNMLLTIQNAYKEVADLTTNHAGEVARCIAHGAIMGSRGNSGTIMSQIWTGFSQVVRDLEVLDAKAIRRALRAASDKAYQGVQSPVEGTILTVIREIAEAAETYTESEDLVDLLEHIVAAGWAAVQKTPDLLPVLKEAGKVDSGGTGLMYILEGMLKAVRGETVVIPEALVEEADEFQAAIDAISHDLSMFESQRYNYDVQFIIKGTGLDTQKIKADIEAMGDSGVIIGSDTLVKVHIHVDDPGIPISYGTKHGILADVVVENMQEQYEALLREQRAKQPRKLELHQVQPGEIAVVAVAAGDGLAQVFAELGVSGIVEGGQTNNPSTEEILKAVHSTNTNRVIILPNNKNIFLAAKQASEIAENIEIVVVPTRTFPQGVAAMLSYLPDGDLADIAQAMTEAKENVITGEITKAIDTVELDGVAVKSGQFIGIVDGKIRRAADTLPEVFEGVLEEANIEDAELVTLYYGVDVTEAQVKAMVENLREKYKNVEFEIAYGGQPHYYYILGVE